MELPLLATLAPKESFWDLAGLADGGYLRWQQGLWFTQGEPYFPTPILWGCLPF